MSSASAISEGTEEVGALQVKKTKFLPLGKTCQSLQQKGQVLQGSEKRQSFSEIMLPATTPCNDLLKNFFTCIWMKAKYKLEPRDLPKHMHMPTQSPRQEWDEPSPLLLALLGRGGVETEIAAELQE